GLGIHGQPGRAVARCGALANPRSAPWCPHPTAEPTAAREDHPARRSNSEEKEYRPACASLREYAIRLAFGPSRIVGIRRRRDPEYDTERENLGPGLYQRRGTGGLVRPGHDPGLSLAG